MWSRTSLPDKWEIPLGTGVFHSAYIELGISEKDGSLELCGPSSTSHRDNISD